MWQWCGKWRNGVTKRWAAFPQPGPLSQEQDVIKLAWGLITGLQEGNPSKGSVDPEKRGETDMGSWCWGGQRGQDKVFLFFIMCKNCVSWKGMWERWMLELPTPLSSLTWFLTYRSFLHYSLWQHLLSDSVSSQNVQPGGFLKQWLSTSGIRTTKWNPKESLELKNISTTKTLICSSMPSHYSFISQTCIYNKTGM